MNLYFSGYFAAVDVVPHIVRAAVRYGSRPGRIETVDLATRNETGQGGKFLIFF